MDFMKEKSTPENQETPPSKEKPARKAEQAADAKAEELRVAVESKGEQGKSGLGFIPKDPDEE
jgi:hypothetical protein